MKVLSDLFAFYADVRRAIKEDDCFDADPDSWLTKNVNAYAVITSTEVRRDVCGYFWIALLWYPTLWLVGKRQRVHHSLLTFIIAGFVAGTIALIVAFLLGLGTTSIRIALLYGPTIGGLLSIASFLDSKPKAEKEKIDSDDDFWEMVFGWQKIKAAKWYTKPFQLLEGVVGVILVCIIAIVFLLPYLAFDYIKDNFCPMVYYVKPEEK